MTAAMHMNNLVEYVLPDTAAYIEWRDNVLDKLVALYPYDEDETLGEVVPQEIFDPTREFNIADTEVLINQFLERLDRDENFILNPPGLMKENHFKFTPYNFDIEKDRKERFEW